MMENLGMALMRQMDPERAHGLALWALNKGLAPMPAPLTPYPTLQVELAGLRLPNPLGLAAGFDKNATAIAPLTRAGFGFIEVGAATPRPQPGNPKPRLFRLKEDRAAINRFGFNNDGMDAIGERLAARTDDAVVGLNLGANKDSDDRSADYAKVLTRCGPHVDFVTVNVSSPNTENLRDLQGADALEALLRGVQEARHDAGLTLPIFLKIAPDLETDEIQAIAEVAMGVGIDAIIATNTTKSREGLGSKFRDEMGGLSGEPLFEMSTRVLAQLHKATNGTIPIIGVGGISTVEQAFEKIAAGATAVQMYTGLVYEGLSVVPRIVTGLDSMVLANEYQSIRDVTGIGRNRWL